MSSQPQDDRDLLRSGWRARTGKESPGARDKMQPSLLDRLTDDAPDKKQEPLNSNLVSHNAQRKLTDAILHFEPRILPQGLMVRCISDTKSLDLHNVLSIEIKGRLWCVPYPLSFLFRTDVDLENGHFELKDVG